MSKAARPRNRTPVARGLPSKEKLGLVDPVPRPAALVDDLRALEQATLGRWLEFSIPDEVRKNIKRLASYISHRAGTWFFKESPTPEQLLDLQIALETSYERGYYLAILRYENELTHVPELAAWHRKRKAGGDRGREKSTQRKEALAGRIRATWASMEAAGQKPTNAAVAAACKCGISTVIRAFKSKPAKRMTR